jgi:hypothetical protein
MSRSRRFDSGYPSSRREWESDADEYGSPPKKELYYEDLIYRIDSYSYENVSILKDAIKAKNYREIKRILLTHPPLDYKIDAFEYALSIGDTAVVDMLLGSGINSTNYSIDPYNLGHYSKEMVFVLIKRGFVSPRSLLLFDFWNIELFTLILDSGPVNVTDVRQIIIQSRQSIIRLKLLYERYPDAFDKTVLKDLMKESRDNSDIISFLLSIGGDINVDDSYLLKDALYFSRYVMIKFCVVNGSNIPTNMYRTHATTVFLDRYNWWIDAFTLEDRLIRINQEIQKVFTYVKLNRSFLSRFESIAREIFKYTNSLTKSVRGNLLDGYELKELYVNNETNKDVYSSIMEEYVNKVYEGEQLLDRLDQLLPRALAQSLN